ncbi:MAG: N-acetylmuramoyl-L-alanine amidase [Bacteroidota bacterium]
MKAIFSTLALSLIAALLSMAPAASHLPSPSPDARAATAFEQWRKDSAIRASSEANYRIRTVVIDPGHGGHDPGCLGAVTQEKDIALQIGLKLGRQIKAHFPHIRVLYTRDRDVFIPLHERAKLANREKADLFISIHCNSVANANYVHGSETFVLGLHRADDNLAVAKRENAAILYEENYQNNYAGYDPNSAENHIMLALFQNAFLDQSINFAEKIEQELQSGPSAKSRGVKQAGFLVLRETTMPSVLIEAGFLTNNRDERYLGGDPGQEQVALAIFRAFHRYKKEVEAESGEMLAALAPPSPIVPSETRSVKIVPQPQVSSRGPSSVTTPPQSLIISNTPPVTNTDHTPALPAREILEYRVQLASGTALIDTKQGLWQQLEYQVEIKKEGRIYKYLSRGFSEVSEAIALRNELRRIGFKDAFVVTYRGTERVK